MLSVLQKSIVENSGISTEILWAQQMQKITKGTKQLLSNHAVL